MKRVSAVILCLAIAVIILIAVCVMALNLSNRDSRAMFTDGDSIRMSRQHAQPRAVLWQPPQPLPKPINTSDHEYEPRFTADGRSLFFVRGKPGGNADLYTASRDAGGAWSDPQPITAVNTADDELGPEISRDGDLLIFHSNRPGGLGGFDLWISRLADGQWQTPVNMGSAINSPHNEYGAALSPDGARLYFASNRVAVEVEPLPADGAWSATLREQRPQQYYDLYLSLFNQGEAEPAAPVHGLNTELNEGAPAFSPAGDFLYFCSDRSEGYGGYDLYRSRWLEGRHLPPANLGSEVNTADNDMDPALGMGGFELVFSSDRTVWQELTDDEPDDARSFDLYVTISREVFLDHEPREPLIDWASLWSIVAPSLLWLLLALLSLLLLLALIKGFQSRQLSLIARCLLASLIAHLVLMLLLTFWQVTVTIAEAIERGGLQVALVSDAAGDEAAEQIRGGLTDVAIDLPATNTDRIETEWSQPSVEVVVETPARPLNAPALDALAMSPVIREAPSIEQESMMPIRPDLPMMAVEAIETTPPMETAAMQSVETAAAALTPSAPKTSAKQETKINPQVASVSPTMPNIAFDTASLDQTQQVMQVVKIADAPTTPSVDNPGMNTADALPLEASPVAIQLPSEHQPTPGLAESSATPSVSIADISSQRLETISPSRTAALESHVQFEPKAPRHAETNVLEPISVSVRESRESVHDRNEQIPAIITPDILPMVTSAAAIQVPPEHRPSSNPAESNATASVSIAVASSRRLESISPPVTPSSETPVQFEPIPPRHAEIDLLKPISVPIRESKEAASDRNEQAVEVSMDIPAIPTAMEATVAIPAEQNAPQHNTVEPKPLLAMPSQTESQRARADATIPLIAPAFIEPQMESKPAAQPHQLTPVEFERVSVKPHVTNEKLRVAVHQELPAIASVIPMAVPALDIALPKEIAPPVDPFVQRSEIVRRELVDRMGGSDATEKAVALALQWLAAHQSEDGRWAAKRFDDDCGMCSGRGKYDTDVAITGLALLCFMGANHTHVKESEYQNVVRRGLTWLVARQKQDGDLRAGETMYSHGIGAIALAEAYGMTRDPALRDAVQSAVEFICDPRNQRAGGWRYEPGQPGDTSVLGWQIMAIHSARSAGIEVPDAPFAVAARWLETVCSETRPGLYAYQPGHRHTPSMTAEAMFVQQLLGLKPDDPRMQQSAEYLAQHQPRWRGDAATYYWYYATLAMFQHQGDLWRAWNAALTEELLAHQRTSGAAAGSWDPVDNWSKIGGRIYQTALCTLCLEVYYRYLPMYSAVSIEDESAQRVP